MDRFICIHGHFYQPPRENPWLEAIEIQDSAYPYHDWNEKVTAECYAPNSASRILDGEGRIINILSNYVRISFDFGPTLLSWMETHAAETYQAILDADVQSKEHHSGHGNAIAQAYNHIILPLANMRDRRTQIIWGIKDFEYRFKRSPDGMWLPETAVDLETLDVLAENRIKFTILAPHQAMKVRRIGTGKWKEISGGRIDPTRAYLCRLPSGRRINIFFYDGPVSNAVAFERLLDRGEDFANRLLSGFSDQRQWPQILNVATDGESYGHHHKFGDMALAYVLNYIESNGLARLMNYAEYLEKYPPTHEVQIFENSSWSCAHGVERWRNNCGCNTGIHPEWNQEWRAPLRKALDWLRDEISSRYEPVAGNYLKSPWNARNEYIGVILNRSGENINKFFEEEALRNLNQDEKVILLKLLELQRHAMLMYTSCGWFFDELSGIETVQVMQYAGRAIQLAEELFNDSIEKGFLERLAGARSNLPVYRNGSYIYEKSVKPALIDLKKVGVHYAVSSLFEDYPDRSRIYCYSVYKEDYQRTEAGRMKLATGRINITSEITRVTEPISFCVLHHGDHNVNGGARSFKEDEAYQSMRAEISRTFEGGAIEDIPGLMDRHFGMHNYSLRDLFRDEQRKFLNFLISKTVSDSEILFRQVYENTHSLMHYLQESGIPFPSPFHIAAEFALNLVLKKAFEAEIDVGKIQEIIGDIKEWNLSIDSPGLEFIIRREFEGMMERLNENPADPAIMREIKKMLDVRDILPFEINLWHAQNTYHRIAKSFYKDFLLKTKIGDENAAKWVEEFRQIGESISFNIEAVLPKE
ncbi:MAG: DUF3536 domain-containing protein [Nitrospirota bacterium]